jgi:Pyruvate/2-oxoacid:ferredoxin oxidoreductase delta subunit
MTVRRKIISVDEEKCDGCGLCLTGCPEGALEVVDGKARLVKESFCDGLGACMGECPRGALRIAEREAEDYRLTEVLSHLEQKSPELLAKHLEHMREHGIDVPAPAAPNPPSPCTSARALNTGSGQLRQWPIKLRLVPPAAPFLKGADLVLVADCVPFAYADMYGHFLAGKAIATGCPKLGDVSAYEQKLGEILEQAGLKSLGILHMEVPCCAGLACLAREAVAKSGREVPLEAVVIGVHGEVKPE